MRSVLQHNAPPAGCAVGTSRYLRCGMWLGWSLGLLSALVFALQGGWQSGRLWQWAVLLLVLLASALWVQHSLQALSRGILRWNGQLWRWTELAESTGFAPISTDAGVQVRLEVVWDAQQALLLRMQPLRMLKAAAWEWLWVERPVDMDLGDWLAFRRAVYSRARHAASAIDQARPS